MARKNPRYKGNKYQIRYLREHMFLTQEKAADRTGIGSTQLSRIENGHHKPSMPTICKLAELFRVSPDELVIWIEDEDADAA